MYKLKIGMTFNRGLTEMENREKGYTLIEMAIALMILGIILAGFFQAFTIYQRQKQIEITDQNVKFAVDRLQAFKQLNGYYPCPAPLTAPNTDESYGRSTDCLDTSITAGTSLTAGATGINGIAVALSARTVTPPTGPGYVPRVRIGAIPFLEMNIDEKSTYDGYGSRLVYALTENMADINTFNATLGGIGIVDASSAAGGSMIDPPNSGLFALYSVGRNKSGGFSANGASTGLCVAGRPESENCDYGTNAIFRSALESNSSDSTAYDDRISFFSSLNDTTWVRSATQSDDIRDLSRGNVGVGTMDPAVKLDIRNASNNPEGTLRTSEGSRVETDVICPSTSGNLSNDNNCFEPRNIAGSNTDPTTAGNPTTAGEGMKCPAGTYMNGIYDGKPICDVVALRCPDTASTMTGVNPTTGAAICSRIPCAPRTVTLCSQSRTIPGASFGTQYTVTAGASRAQNYQCSLSPSHASGVNWVTVGGATGVCDCTPSVTTTNGIPCGEGWNGEYSETVTRVCPSNSETTTNTWGANCVCAPRDPWITNVACPAGQSGGYVDTRVWRCPSGSWGPVVRTGSCSCNVPAVTTEVVSAGSCDPGHDGQITQTRIFDTPTCSWVNQGDLVNTCVCNSTETRTVAQDPSCLPSHHVATPSTILETRTGENCTFEYTETLVPGTCEPNIYRWRIVSSPGGENGSGRVGPIPDTDSCTYAQYSSGTPQTCSKPEGGGRYSYHECQCRQ